jgi:hypothetical protein
MELAGMEQFLDISVDVQYELQVSTERYFGYYSDDWNPIVYI